MAFSESLELKLYCHYRLIPGRNDRPLPRRRNETGLLE